MLSHGDEEGKSYVQENAEEQKFEEECEIND